MNQGRISFFVAGFTDKIDGDIQCTVFTTDRLGDPRTLGADAAVRIRIERLPGFHPFQRASVSASAVTVSVFMDVLSASKCSESIRIRESNSPVAIVASSLPRRKRAYALPIGNPAAV
jgi:hypothetical protein